jgi:hypothetical protein
MAISWTNCKVALGDLLPQRDNPRYLTRTEAQRLRDSLDEFGLVDTIAIGPDDEVYNGHQRLAVLLRLHGPDYEVDARRASRTLSDEERRRLTVLLHAGAVGSWDWDRLAGWDVEALMADGVDSELLSSLNNDAANVALMLEAQGLGPPPSDDEPPPGGDQGSTVLRCPQCGYEFQLVEGDSS